MEPMIHVFHGFLGSPDDFNFIKADEVMIHDLYSLEASPIIHEDDVLIGYSMGGRIALELASNINYNLKKIILINAHPGLSTSEDKLARIEFETKILRELQTRKKEDFLEWWNNLPLFTHDQPIVTSDERYQKSSELFQRYRLSDQADHLPHMVKNKDKILFIVGVFDEKYMELVTEFLIPNDIPVKGLPGGHRLFQNEKELLGILKAEGIL
jgi:2-succinyl-6-hydroxy-2,4-cyclohexadiene-1-carboxylate synthase